MLQLTWFPDVADVSFNQRTAMNEVYFRNSLMLFLLRHLLLTNKDETEIKKHFNI